MAKHTSSEEALRRLRDHLGKGALASQFRLESERALAERIGCSRETLRKAIRVLELEGRVWRHVGQGTFLGPRPAHEPIPPMVLVETASPADIIDARLLLEPGIAATAAQKATHQDLTLLRELVGRTMRAADWQAYEVADNAFHKAIARSSGNPVAIAFLDILSSVRSRVRWQREHNLTFRRDRKKEYTEQQSRMHGAIIDAIEARDPEGARQAMNDHLCAIRKVMVVT
ncbi:FCD domain-containing protein [Jiella sp. 40Bstr34]|uniref:FCD domain-containing protein n=2 Tax=Jiella pacifica TaxID=2696469 RepID=A0A6N9T936_9HYPH|nr:FCD domain-containing protein [Jiella pacifica]